MATANDTEFSAASALAGLATTQRKEEMDHDNEEEFHIPQRFTKSGRKRAVPFTIKLMKVLSDKKNAHIITWMPSGKSFNILKPKVFVADILPEHFKTAKYSSFTRKLHRWGFMRHYRGEEAGAFYHKDFQRGRLDLVEQMTCHKAEPPKSTPVITAAVVAEKQKALVKPAPLRPAAAANGMVQQQPKPLVGPPMLAPPPATPETIKMSVLKVPTSAMASAAITTPVVTRTPVITTTPSLSMANMTSALPPMAPRLTPASAAAGGGSSAAAMSTSDRLNAAIELEVNRRIKERINAVALQRQAFAVSALRQQQLAASLTTTNPHHHHHTTTAATAAFENHQRQQQQMAALLLQKQAGLFKNAAMIPQTTAPNPFRALAPEGQSLPGAPPKNIHGARTA